MNVRALKGREIFTPVEFAPDFERTLSSQVRIDFGAATHPGKRRETNEDAYVIYKTGRYWERLDTSLPDADLPELVEENGYAMAVADGVGGNAAGEVASALALKVIVGLVIHSARWALKLDAPETRDQEIEAAKKRAEEYFKKADEALLEHAKAFPALQGMGTTLTGAYSTGKDLLTVHVGDSRAYLYRGGRLMRLTHDQTVAQALADTGGIPQEAVSKHWMRHTLTSSLGGKGGMVDLQMGHTQIGNGDRILLCSDGLTEMAKEAEIAEVLARQTASQPACDALVQLALAGGGKDNVTVLLSRYAIPE